MADSSASAASKPAPVARPEAIEALVLAEELISRVQTGPPSSIKALLDRGAPTWFQDEALGWSCLHYAAERRDEGIMRMLLRAGGVWNAVDKWGRTAGEVCISFGWEDGWEMVRNEGVRSEMLHHAVNEARASEASVTDDEHVTLRAKDTTSAGDNRMFLRCELRWEVGDDGRERVLDADGNGVMMGWEEPLMCEHVRLMLRGHSGAADGTGKGKAKDDGPRGLSILNVGYGLGIVDRLFQSQCVAATSTPPRNHTIIEAHPQVLAHMRAAGVYDWAGVRVLEGRWQDFLIDNDRMGEVLSGVPEGFDAVFVDTFAEGYEDLKQFFEFLPDILEPEHGMFSFWNGLGATNATIYDVSSHLADLHLEEVGLETEWHNVPIPESLRSEVWNGVRRRYWDLPGYKLPISRMMVMSM